MIYVHVPFCASKCHYCDFYSVASSAGISAMVDAICSEVGNRRDFLCGAAPGTLYFGGGTPSILCEAHLTQIVSSVRANFDTLQIAEQTLEANPEHLTQEYLDMLLALGFNRLSVGVQSFHNDHLSGMNRRHSSADSVSAIGRAQKAGFDNISIDLIYGLPFMSDQQWLYNLDQAVDLGIQHISAYHLSIEEGTVFHRRGVRPVDEERSAAQYDELCRKLADAGFEHYEISSFARPSYRSRHNSGYWTGQAYLGVGPSAHSFDGVDTRSWNIASNRLYVEGENISQSEQLTARDIHNEYLMTRLRTKDGITPDHYTSLFGRHFTPDESMIFENERWRIAERDWLVSDSIIGKLFE